jgi:hypothetical protein
MTSIEWLIDRIRDNDNSPEVWERKKLQAKEMHKAEIIDAFDEGQEYEYQYHINNAPKFDSETYYQETFKKD